MNMHLAKVDVPLFLKGKREHKANRKRHLAAKRRTSRARAKAHREAKQGFFGEHSLIARMFGANARTELRVPQTSMHLTVPSTFSMFEDPEGVLDLIASFALTHQNRSISDVYVDFQAVKVQDLGAHALLDKLVDEIVAQVNFRRGRMGWKGNFPDDAAQKRFIKAMGIIRQLGLTKKYLDPIEAHSIHLFERRCRHYVRSLKPQNPHEKSAQGNAAQRFVEHVNKCLAREGRELTPEGRIKLCDYVVEVIDNAENHAGMVDWTIQGYVDMAMEEPLCEIVIFNFGKSISESLDELPPDSYTMRSQVQPYLDLHSKNGWISPKWRREDLMTLIALQGSVSSRNKSVTDTRGQGTADLIESFQAMNDERSANSGAASLYLISGGTRILFNHKYRLVRGSDGTRKIAFNAENDLNKPPDSGCVMPLKSGLRMPGTIIGIKFGVASRIMQLADNIGINDERDHR